MAEVVWTQYIDGVQSGEPIVAREAISADQALDFLDVKYASHVAHGWTVTRTEDGFESVKAHRRRVWRIV